MKSSRHSVGSRIAIVFLSTVLTGLFCVPIAADTSIITDFEDPGAWQVNHAANSKISLESVPGRTGKAVRIRYDVSQDHWVEIGQKSSVDWRRIGTFHFYLRGDANGSVIELKLLDEDGSYYGLKLPITGISPKSWTKVSVPFRDCHYLWGGDNKLDNVVTIWFAVSRGLARAGYVDIDDYSYTVKAPGSPTMQVQASQIGYHPWDVKPFVVRVMDAAPSAKYSGTFEVVSLHSPKPVARGMLEPSSFSMWQGRFFRGDFSSLRAKGDYQINVTLTDGKTSWASVSYPFSIGDRVLSDKTAQNQYHYIRFMRCGITCHKDDPVPGGYHDTQMDISKRMWTIPHLIMALARYSTRGMTRFDADTDGIDDPLDEVRFGLKFIADVPEPDGTVSWGGIEADFKPFMTYEQFITRLGPLKREEDTLPRIKYREPSFHGTCFNTVALIEASEAVRPAAAPRTASYPQAGFARSTEAESPPEGAALADRAESVARNAWKWIDAQPMSAAHDYGAYLLAAATLNRRFPGGGYLHRIDEVLPKLFALQSLDPSAVQNGAVGNYFYSPSEKDFHFQYKFTSFYFSIHQALVYLEEDLPHSHPLWPRIHYSNSVFTRTYLPRMSDMTPYGQIAHGLEPGKDGKFHPKQFSGKWGERAAASFHGLNCDHFGYAYIAMKYAQLVGDAQLERFADDQIQWALGQNPLGYCMMAGAGSLNPIHMSAYYDKGPIVGEIPNGIVSGDEENEEPQWWGDGPSSGEDWMPHNCYYVSLISELDRDASLTITVTRGAMPVSGNVIVEREDGVTVAKLKLTAGRAGPVALAAQAKHTIKIDAGNSSIVRTVTPVSGQLLQMRVDLDRDIVLEWAGAPNAPAYERDVVLSLAVTNRSDKPVEVTPKFSIVGGVWDASTLPQKFTVRAKERWVVDDGIKLRITGGQPVLARVEDALNTKTGADLYWVPDLPVDPGAAPPAMLDDMNDASGWGSEKDQGANISAASDNGALRLAYSMGSGKWAQVKKDFDRDIRGFNTMKFRLKGSAAPNRVEIKLEDADGSNVGYTVEKFAPDWVDHAVPLKEFKYWWGGDNTFDASKLKRIYFAVSGTGGGSGTLWVDDIEFASIAGKTEQPVTPQAAFEYVKGDRAVAQKAAAWIASMQKPSGLILSYEGDHKPFAWTFDQGLCLIVLANENRPAAERLIDALRKLQKPEGYWNDGYMLDEGKKIELGGEDQKKWFAATVPGVQYEYDNRWIGSAAWVVHGLYRYMKITGDRRCADMFERGAKWLASQQRADGSLHDVTEGNMTSWRAMKEAGLTTEADKVKEYLLTKVWNEEEGRFLVSPTNTQPYLDVQTWGASFAVAAGVPARGLRSLAYARRHFECATQDSSVRGFDATGAVTVWNEGTLQYVVAGGAGAAEYMKLVGAHQRADGAMRHSQDELSQGGSWHTRMYGVCPSAWLYFANSGTEPFPIE